MTFGRSPHDQSTGFGPGPAAAAFDAPYADGPADGFGGRGPAADGFGGRSEPLSAGPQRGGSEGDRPVTHAELAEHTEREHLVRAYQDLIAIKYQRMVDAVRSTCDRLEARKPPRTSMVVELVNMAASAAVAGAAGVVAEILAQRLSTHLLPEFDRFRRGYQRFANDAIKEHLKKSFQVGIATSAPVTLDDLRYAFRDAQVDKLLTAQSDFVVTFTDGPAKALAQLPVEALRSAVAAEHANQQDPEVRGETARGVALEWANLVARVRHGAGEWDTWAGPHGGRDAVPTDDAAPPDFSKGNSAAAAGHASAANVDANSDSIRDATDDDQRRMNPTLHGILEINLWASGVAAVEGGASYARRHTSFELFTHRGHGMRLAGVSDHAKRLIAEYPTVGDVKMNKIIAIFDDTRLNPPKPVGRFLVTADGYIRRTSTEGGEAEMQDAAEFARGLPMSLLQ